MRISLNSNHMMKHHRVILEESRYQQSFVPALLVKGSRHYPLDYRKRLSEMKEKGWVKRAGNYERFAVWQITKEGKKALKSVK